MHLRIGWRFIQILREGITIVFKISEKVLLKGSTKKRLMRLSERGKLSPYYIGQYIVPQRIGKVTYSLALPTDLCKVHCVFHVSKLWNTSMHHLISFHPNLSSWNLIFLLKNKSSKYLDTKLVKFERRKLNLSGCYVWSNHGVEEATWEVESDMKSVIQIFSFRYFEFRDETLSWRGVK